MPSAACRAPTPPSRRPRTPSTTRRGRLRDADRHAEALPLLRTLVRDWPNAGYFMLCSDSEAELLLWDDAEASARAALKLKPDSWTTWRQMGQCLEAQSRDVEAAPAYERSLELRDNPATRVLYASMLRRSGDLEDARRHLEACARAFPEWGEGWLNLGGTWQEEDPERALRLMQSALEIDPECGLYHAWVAYMHGVLAHVEEARHHLREARRLGSDHPDFEGVFEDTSGWLLKIDQKRRPRSKPVAE